MPLPKTATIAARATEVYCEVWSVILQRFCKLPPTRTTDLNDLSQLLPYLRQLLTCCACAGLLDKAMVSLTCGHCYCYECQFREPLLKIHCRQCRERTGLVIERQLQLVVSCYKSMCHILGEELRKDPMAFANGENQEANRRDTLKPGTNQQTPLRAPKSEPSPETEKESTLCEEIKENRSSLPANGLTVDPIAEIIREVEKGTKVSRAIFIIKPPSKYMNARAGPTFKKDLSLSSTVSSKAQSLSLAKDKSKESTPELLTKLSDSTDADHEGKEGMNEVEPSSVDLDFDIDNLAHSKKRTHKKSSESRRKHKPSAPKSADIGLSGGSEVSGRPLTSENSETKLKLTKIPIANLKLSSRQRNLNARKRKQALKILSKSKLEASKEEKVQAETGGGSRSEERTEQDLSEAPMVPKLVATLDTDEAASQVDVKDLNVSVTCLDDRYLSINEDKVIVQPHEQLSYKLKQALEDTSRPAPNFVHGAARDQWKTVSRRRTLSPFCSRVVVTRLGEDIARNIALMITAAKGKRKMRQKAKLAATVEGIKNHLPVVSSSSHSPRARSRLSKAHRHSVPTPPVPVPPMIESNDIPIPEHIPILSADGKDAINDADINWTEFSNFFESNEEESIPELSTLDCYTPARQQHQQQQQQQQLQQQNQRHHKQQLSPALPPPPLPPPPCKRNLEPLTFREYGPPTRMMQHPPHPRPCLPMPPHRPHPPLPHPPHLPHSLPPPHPPPPPPPPPPHPHAMMPFSPMMGPDIPPHEFFPPPMTPGGVRPDMGGFSSPMTPRGPFPGDPCMDGIFHQGSPGRHPRGGNFPFPNSSGAFSPVSRGSFSRPTPPTTPVVVHQQKKKSAPTTTTSSSSTNSSSEPIASMVTKMKVKPQQQSTPPKNLLTTPSTPTKKRRSPGYSEAGWRCRCGTNKIMFPEKVCAKGKCPCYAKGSACKNCLCRFCHNPFGPRESTKTTSSPTTKASLVTTSSPVATTSPVVTMSPVVTVTPASTEVTAATDIAEVVAKIVET